MGRESAGASQVVWGCRSLVANPGGREVVQVLVKDVAECCRIVGKVGGGRGMFQGML